MWFTIPNRSRAGFSQHSEFLPHEPPSLVCNQSKEWMRVGGTLHMYTYTGSERDAVLLGYKLNEGGSAGF